MTLDEAIEERLKVIKVQEKLYEESYSDESKEIIKNATDNDRQIVEWLRQLKEAKRLLKLAILDIYHKCSCENSDCDICAKNECDYDDRFIWQYKDEAFKIIDKE